jgi:tryptophan-rich sensory protein
MRKHFVVTFAIAAVFALAAFETTTKQAAPGYYQLAQRPTFRCPKGQRFDRRSQSCIRIGG